MNKNLITKELNLLATNLENIALNVRNLSLMFSDLEVSVDAPVEEVQTELPIDDKKDGNIVETSNTDPVKDTDNTNSDIEESVVYTEESLNKLTYAELKKVVKSLNLSPKGTKIDLIKLILNQYTEEITESKEELVTAPVIIEDAAGVPIVSDTDKEDIEISEEIEKIGDVDEEEEEVLDSTLYDKVSSHLVNYTLEDLADILNQLGISSKGKRQVLLNKIVRAVEMDLIDLEFEENPVDEVSENPIKEVEETPVEKIEESKPKSKSKELAIKNKYVPTLSDIYEGASETRKPTILDEWKTLDTAFEDKSLTKKDILEILNNYHKKDLGHLSDMDCLFELKLIYANLVDDEGNPHDFEEPYEFNDTYCCCGKELNSVDDGLQCSICNTLYETE